jgi:ATP-dependent Clp protease protease subunit
MTTLKRNLKLLLQVICVLTMFAVPLGLVMLLPRGQAPEQAPKVEKNSFIAEVIIPQDAPPTAKVRIHKVENLNIDMSRTINLTGEISDKTVNLLVTRIMILNAMGDDPIFLILDSPGGDVRAGLKLIAYMDALETPIYTVVFGECDSMCAHVSQHGRIRYMMPGGYLMFHEAYSSFQNVELTKLQSYLTALEKDLTRLNNFSADRAKIPRATFVTEIAHEMQFSAFEAYDRGFVDKLAILTPDKDSLLRATGKH